MLIIGLLSIALAIALVVFLVGDKAAGRASGETAVATLPAPPFPGVPRPGAGPAAELPSLYRRFASLAGRFTPAGHAQRLQRRLDLAGNPQGWSAERAMAFKGIGLITGVALGLLLGAEHGAWLLVFAVIGGLAGFFLPDVWIKNVGAHRQEKLLLGLPDAIDMMTVCVEAGLGFDAALARVALNLDGPIASEFARVLQEMQFGKSRTQALRALSERTDVSEIRTFVSSLVQSTELGISIGDVLREQSKEMRVRRRQRAEEKAQKLPVKILFPLLFCMLPSMFVVVIGPAAIKILKTFGAMSL